MTVTARDSQGIRLNASGLAFEMTVQAEADLEDSRRRLLASAAVLYNQTLNADGSVDLSYSIHQVPCSLLMPCKWAICCRSCLCVANLALASITARKRRNRTCVLMDKDVKRQYVDSCASRECMLKLSWLE